MDLERLIETEQRLDQALRQARDEAAELVRAAQEAARAREAQLQAEIESATREVDAGAASERARREADVARETGLLVERYETVSEERIRAAARAVVERLLAVDQV